ncbi:hypothetical protein Tco_1095110, partial [Tanacetum coccineum]
LAIPLDGIQVDDKLNFIEEPVEIMDREVKRLKQSRIPIVKVRWNSRRGPKFTWEREDQMQKKYPHLFTNSAPAAELQPYSTEEADYEEKTVVRIDERDYDCEKSISPGKATRKEENFINEDLRGMINKLEPRADGTLGIKSIRSWIPYLVDLGPDMYIPALSCSVLRRLSWREIAWLMKPLAIPSGEVQDCTTIGISLTKPVEIMDREVKCLKQSRIPIVKVRWNSKRGPEFTSGALKTNAK